MKEPKTLFDTWLRSVANQALCEGLVDVDDVENLYTNVKEAAYQQGYLEGYQKGTKEADYQQGYKLGHSDGYGQALMDLETQEGEDK